MNIKPFGCLVLMLAVSPLAWAQTADATAADTPAPAIGVSPKEDAQSKALRQQLEREMAARKAEADAAIAADIARNPDGANAIAARKADADKKALELLKQAADDKAKADGDVGAKAAAEQAASDSKAAAAAWAAGAKERERVAAQKKAAVEAWRKSGKPAPSILMSKKSDGTFTVMVDGKISTFSTAAEAQAYADKIRSDGDPSLSY